MNNSISKENDSNKLKLAVLSILMSAAGIIVDAIMRRPVLDTFSIGFVLTFGAFLVSLASVKGHGSNLPAQIAFWL
ncbi:MAG: hypothetical protein E7240_10470, partial [Lachnospiraceae bacterium]|nr:hypothetical protein [Lachnospiraceae bacterium]